MVLDGFTERPLEFVGPLDLSWCKFPAAAVVVGQRITAEVTAVDLDQGQAWLSMAATENAELWAFSEVPTIPELSWRRFETASEIVQVGQRVSCEFLQFDTTNGEVRLSLRATQPDPFQTIAQKTTVGQTLLGRSPSWSRGPLPTTGFYGLE